MSNKGTGSSRTPHEMMTKTTPFELSDLDKETDPSMYFLQPDKYDWHDGQSKTKGYEYQYYLSEAAKENCEIQEMEVLNIVKTFSASQLVWRQDVVRFPEYTRRIVGVSPIFVPFLTHLCFVMTVNFLMCLLFFMLIAIKAWRETSYFAKDSA